MHQTTDKPFRVIIVGAGVSGLILAHALQLAKTDFVLLEKGVVAPPWGSSITGIISMYKYMDPLTDSTSNGFGRSAIAPDWSPRGGREAVHPNESLLHQSSINGSAGAERKMV